MPEPEWKDAVEKIQPYVVKITTPSGFGTGFLFSRSKAGDLVGVATAAHVISHAHMWDEPIRIEHFDSEKTVTLKEDSRAVFIEEAMDTAAIVFARGDIPFPEILLGLSPEGKYLRIGNEIGWVGFPALSPSNLCFFTGRTSAYIEEESAYLVDGVTINGVSGGPAFFPEDGGSLIVMGVVSAYIPNRATGEVLPGLSVVRDVKQFQSLIRSFASIEEAKKDKDASLSLRKMNGQNGGSGA